MSGISPEKIIEAFNHAAEELEKAVAAAGRDERTEEAFYAPLRRAAAEFMEVMEWLMKLHTKNIKIDKRSASRTSKADFYYYLDLMKRYGCPPLDPDTADLIAAYRRPLRNLPRHESRTPPLRMVQNAAAIVSQLVLMYIPQARGKLKAEGLGGRPLSDLNYERENYFSHLRDNFRYMDMRGVSPQTGSIPLRLADLFRPLKVSDPVVARVDSTAKESGVGSATSPVDFRRILGRNRLLVVGEPGSGKTTLCQYIAFALASNSDEMLSSYVGGYIPVILRANDLVSYLEHNLGSDLYHYLVRGSNKYRDLFRSAIESGKCLLMIDGLDEAPGYAEARAVWKLIEGFDSWIDVGNKILVTTREGYYEENLVPHSFWRCRLLPFDVSDIEEYVKDYFENYVDTDDALGVEAEDTDEGDVFDADDLPEYEEDLVTDDEDEEGEEESWIDEVEDEEEEGTTSEIDKFIDRLREDENLQMLYGIPFHLAVAAGLREFSDTKIDLLNRLAESYVEIRPAWQGREPTVPGKCIAQIIEILAYKLLSSNRSGLTQYQLERFLRSKEVGQVLGSVSKTEVPDCYELFRMLRHTGLIGALPGESRKATRYGFRIRNFAEYFAARYLARVWLDQRTAWRRIRAEVVLTPKWNEVLRLMYEYLTTCGEEYGDDFFEELLALAAPSSSYPYTYLFRTGYLLARGARPSDNLREEAISRLAKVFVEVRYVSVWLRALECLVGIIKRGDDLYALEELLSYQEGDSPILKLRKAVLRIRTGYFDEVDLGIILNGMGGDDYTRAHLVPVVEELKMPYDLGSFLEDCLFGGDAPDYEYGRPCFLCLCAPDRKSVELLSIRDEVASVFEMAGLVKTVDLSSEKDVATSDLYCFLLKPEPLAGLGEERLTTILLGAADPIRSAVIGTLCLWGPMDTVMGVLDRVFDAAAACDDTEVSAKAFATVINILEAIWATVRPGGYEVEAMERLPWLVISHPCHDIKPNAIVWISNYIDHASTILPYIDDYMVERLKQAAPDIFPEEEIEIDLDDFLARLSTAFLRVPSDEVLIELTLQIRNFGPEARRIALEVWQKKIGSSISSNLRFCIARGIIDIEGCTEGNYRQIAEAFTATDFDIRSVPEPGSWFKHLARLAEAAPSRKDLEWLSDRAQAFLLSQRARGVELEELILQSSEPPKSVAPNVMVFTSRMALEAFGCTRSGKGTARIVRNFLAGRDLRIVGLALMCICGLKLTGVSPLKELLSHSDDRIKRFALHYIDGKDLKSEEILCLVCSHLNSQDPEVRQKSARLLISALLSEEASQIEPTVRRILTDEMSHSRLSSEAVYVLSGIVEGEFTNLRAPRWLFKQISNANSVLADTSWDCYVWDPWRDTPFAGSEYENNPFL